MRAIGDVSLPFFYSSVQVTGQHNAPSTDTPVLVCANHGNTILDVAMLASHMPERRPLHFWAKSGFFSNPVSSWILTSCGNIRVDRKNKNNQALFRGTFEAMKAGGGIALFPEGGSYTIPALAKLKLGAAWAALEYSRYLQTLQTSGESANGKPKTNVNILPAAIMYDDRSVFRSRAILQFGPPISLDNYIEEFLSAPPITLQPEQFTLPEKNPLTTVPPTPIAMTRTNTGTSTGHSAPSSIDNTSPAQKAVIRLTKDLFKALNDLNFNAPDWPTYQAVRSARELIFELRPDSLEVAPFDMKRYVLLSRSLMTLLSLDGQSEVDQELRDKSKAARESLFVYQSLLHLNDVHNVTLARMLRRYKANDQLSSGLPSSQTAWSALWSAVKSFALRVPYYLPVYLTTLVPTYIVPNRLALHYAGKEEESMSSVRVLFSVACTFWLAVGLGLKVMHYARWSPPSLLVAVAGIWWLHHLNVAFIDTAYSLVKQIRFGWRVWQATKSVSGHDSQPSATQLAEKDMDTANLFFYGTLVHPSILARVIGNSGSHLTVQNGILQRTVLCHVKGEDYPGLIQSSSLKQVFTEPNAAAEIHDSQSDVVKGTLVCGLTARDLRCLDAFEGGEYQRARVQIVLDPESQCETNAERISKGGDKPLHSILSTLTPARIASITSAAADGSVKTVQAQTYTWAAGTDKLEAKVWEFDRFAREKAGRWVSGDRHTNDNDDTTKNGAAQRMEKVENEFEYEIVDRIRDEAAPASMPAVHDFVQDEPDTFASTRLVIHRLTNDVAIQTAIETTVKHLTIEPSIQHFVNQAFTLTSSPRPSFTDPHLISALFQSRHTAQLALATLFSLVEKVYDSTAEIQAAMDAVRDEKKRVLTEIYGTQSSISTTAIWPFPGPLHPNEPKKTI